MYVYTDIHMNMSVYTYIHTYIHDTFKKLALLKATLPCGCFSRHLVYFFFFILLYSFIIDNAKPICLF